MTFEEFKILAKTMKSLYARMFEDEDAVVLWYSMLADLDYKRCAAALTKHVQTSEFPPTVASLRRGASEQPAEDGMTELEAWAMARKAIRANHEAAEEQYNRLPELVRRAIGDVSNLTEWALMPSDQVGSVIQSHFVRNFRTVKERAKEEAAISPAVRQALEITQSNYKQIKEVKR